MNRREIFVVVFCLVVGFICFRLIQLTDEIHDKKEEECQAKGGVIVWGGNKGTIGTCVDPKVIIK